MCLAADGTVAARFKDLGMSSFGQLKKSNRHLAFKKDNFHVASDLHAAPAPGRLRVALSENCFFYISPMYEFLHSQGQQGRSGLTPDCT